MKTKLLQLSGLLMSITPLSIYVGINWEEYAPTTVETWKLGTGGMIVAVIMALISFGKMGLPKRTFILITALVLVWLMNAILEDILWILIWTLSGVMVDDLAIQPSIERTRKFDDAVMQAKVQKMAMDGKFDKPVKEKKPKKVKSQTQTSGRLG